jgi:hypothetical protein
MLKFINIIVSASLIFLGVIIKSCSSDLEKIKTFNTYVNAVNQNDVSEALSTHTQDAEFIIPGQKVIRGSENLRSLLQWDSVLQSRIKFTDLKVHGDTLIAGAGSERNFWFDGIGLDSIVYASGTRVVFQGKFIKGIYPATIVSESSKELERCFQRFMIWATQNASEDLVQLMPDGFFIYNSESAKEWIKLFDYYNSQNFK